MLHEYEIFLCHCWLCWWGNGTLKWMGNWKFILNDPEMGSKTHIVRLTLINLFNCLFNFSLLDFSTKFLIKNVSTHLI